MPTPLTRDTVKVISEWLQEIPEQPNAVVFPGRCPAAHRNQVLPPPRYRGGGWMRECRVQKFAGLLFGYKFVVRVRALFFQRCRVVRGRFGIRCSCLGF